MLDIKKNLNALVEKQGFSQKQVAAELGITQQAYSAWFNRSKGFTFEHIEQVCEVINVSVVDVITYPAKYVDSATLPKECNECVKKQETIDNLNELIRLLKKKQKI